MNSSSSFVSYSWEEILLLFTSSTEITCSLRLLDTIFRGTGQRQKGGGGGIAGGGGHGQGLGMNEWYFTTKNGTISKKKIEKSTTEAISSRFMKFAMSNPNNSLGYVGVLIQRDGTREYLRENDLLTALTAPIDSESFLQVYLRPYGGIDQIIKINYSNRNNNESFKVLLKTSTRETDDLNGLGDSSFISDQSIIFTREILKCLSQSLPDLFVTALQSEFIIDDNKHVWLSKISNLQLQSKQSPNSANSPDPQSQTFDQTLPELPNSSQSGNRKLQSTSTPAITSSPRESAAIFPQKLLSREGGIFHCEIGPEDLPGLRSWILTSLSNQQTPSSNDWMIDFSEYTADNLQYRAKNKEINQNRYRITRAIGMKMIQLVDHFQPLLKGEIRIENVNDFILRWKSFYHDFTRKMKEKKGKSSSAEVTVDGNCHAICRKIQSLIDINFEAKPYQEKEKDLNRPNSESNLHPTKQKRNTDRSTQAESALEINRVKSSPAIPLHNPPNQPLQNHLEDRDLDSIASVSVITELDSVVDKSPDKTNHKSKNPYEIENKKGKKTKRDERLYSVPSNTPPNFDLLAKFAVEKERQKKLQEDNVSQSQFSDQLTQSTKQKKSKNQQNNKSRKENETPAPRSLEEDEKRILELERIATAHSAAHRLNPQTPFLFNASGQFSLTGSEEEFMLRELERGNTSHVQSKPLPIQEGSGSASLTSVKSSFENDVAQKLTEKLNEKDRKIKQLVDVIDEKEKELSKKEKKYSELNKKFIEFRSEAYEEKDRLKNEHETEILQLKEQHAKQMSNFAMNAGVANSGSASNPNSPLKVDPFRPTPSQSSNGMTSLMEQLERLRHENKLMSDRLTTEKKTLQTEYNLKVLGLETKYNENINKYKETITRLEDQSMKLFSEKEMVSLQVSSLTEEVHQQELQKGALQNQIKKLENDVKQLQNSINNSYKLEASQGIGPGQPGPITGSGPSLDDLKNEAKIRQLTNQIEFLKSQLSAELASVEEMKSLIETSKEKTELLKNDFRERMIAMEKQRVGDIQAAEERVECKYEIKIKELNMLQSKYQQLTNQLKESYNENEISKEREMIQKNNNIKFEQQILVLVTENNQLKRELNELKESQDHSTGHDVDVTRHQQESLIRRIDNERQYLKSQLSSEIILKNELQNSVNMYQEKLHDIQRQWNEDVEILRNTNKQLESESILIEQKLQQKIHVLSTTNDHLTGQLNELKEGYKKIREQLRHEEIMKEKDKITINQLKQEIENYQEEIKSLQDTHEQTLVSYQQQVTALRQTLEENEKEKNHIIQSLREELSRQFLEISAVQKESLQSKREAFEERSGINRKIEALRIYSSLTRWYQNRISQTFHVWKKNATLITATEQFKKKLNQILKKKEEEVKREREYERDQIQREEKRKYEEILADAKKRSEKELSDLQNSWTDKESQIRSECEEKYAEQISGKEKEWNDHIIQLERSHQIKIYEIEEKYKLGMTELKIALRDELNQRLGVNNEEHREELKRISQQVTEELTKKYEEKYQEQEDEWYDKLRRGEREKELEKERREKTFQEQIENEKKKYDQNLLLELENVNKKFLEDLKRKEKEHSDSIMNLLEEKKVELKTHLEECRYNHSVDMEERVRSMRRAYDDELQEKLKQKEAEMNELFVKKLSEMNLETNETRNKLIKLETNKWQQILKETEKRYVLEIQQMRSKTMEEMEKKYHEEMGRIRSESDRKILITEEKYLEKMNELKQDQQLQIESLRNQQEMQLEETVRATTQSVTKQLNETMEERMISLVADMKESLKKEYSDILQKEMTQNEKLKTEIYQMQQRFGEERRQLQTIIDTTDLRIQQKEITLKEQSERYESSLEIFRDQQKQREKKLLNDLRDELLEEKEVELTRLRKEVENDYSKQFEREKELLDQELDLQMKTIQKENEKLVSRLEEAMNDLQAEKNNLTNELERITTQLETSEDELYDKQQEILKLNKANSLLTWKTITKLKRYGLYCQKEMEKQQKESAEILAKTESDSKKILEEYILLCFRLSYLIYNNENQRNKLSGLLTRYKYDELIEKKTTIKLLEKEINGISDEMTLYDQQKDVIQDEVNELEDEIKQLEEQSREFNQSSSVLQNGRINLSHTRKKKRIDTELERLLDLIEQKRSQMTHLDQLLMNLTNKKEEKEIDMMTLEKSLMMILIEQQKLVLNGVEENKEIEEKGKMMMKLSNLNWPPPENPTRFDVENVIKTIQQQSANKVEKR